MTHEPKIIFFDESGYTGPDLLNKQQPIFSLVSVDIPDDEARELLRSTFPNYQGEEFKFSKIWKQKSNRKNLTEFARKISKMRERIFIHQSDKKFSLLTSFIDLVVEPMFRDKEYDFYAHGFNRYFANYLHYYSPQIYAAVIPAHHQFLRSPNQDTLSELQECIYRLEKNCREEIKPVIDLLTTGAKYFHRYSRSESWRIDNDIHILGLSASILFWKSFTEKDLIIIHDYSSKFLRQIDMWKKVTSPEITHKTIKVPGQTEVTFPISIRDTRMSNSEDSFSIQLCDMTAGLANKILQELRSRTNLEFHKNIIKAGFGEMFRNGTNPNPEFEKETLILSKFNGPTIREQLDSIFG